MDVYIDANDLRRDNVAVLAERREILIGWGLSDYTDESWDILADVIRTTTSLKTLVLYDSTVTALQNDKVVDALAKNRTIRSLDLWSANGGDEGAKAVAAILKDNSTIEEVNLSYNDISDEGAKAIADSLKENTSILCISLNKNQIGNEGAKAIADSLKENASFRELYIGRNSIGDEGAKAIADSLKKNASLRKLGIEGNNIGAQGAKVIADALKENASLRELYIHLNNIGEKGGKYILNALRWNTSLQKLFIGGNKIGDQGSKFIAETLKENHSLKELSIQEDNIGEKGGQYILNALQQIERSAIENIDLWETNISDETMEKIDQAIARIQNRFKSDAAKIQEMNDLRNLFLPLVVGKAAANAIAAAESQDVSNEDEGLNTIHTTNAPQGSAENVQETNRTGHNTTVIETKIREQQSTIAQQQGKIAEQDKELASMKDIMKKSNEMVIGRHGSTTSNVSNASMPDREAELQSEIEHYKQEIDSLKEQLKNSRLIETVDLTNEVETAKICEDESGGEKASSKRRYSEHRNDHGPKRTRNSTTQVQVKQENIKEGTVKCPDPDCGSIVLLSEKGCNRVVCMNMKHTPHYLYFCAHCKTPCGPYSETLGCDCPKRNTPAARERAQEMRNKRARENPEVLE